MKMDTDNPEFWRRVEREMRNANPRAYVLQNTLIKAGINLSLMAALYLILYNVLEPSKGYFFSELEVVVHPFIWGLFSVIMILIGAVFRYRSMSPVVDKLKYEHW